MGEGVATPFTHDGGVTVDFAALLLLGRDRGYLTPDDVMVVLEAVTLTPALIDAVVGRVRAEGIVWREEGDSREEGGCLLGVPGGVGAPGGGLSAPGGGNGPEAGPDNPGLPADRPAAGRTEPADGDVGARSRRAALGLVDLGLHRLRGRLSVADLRLDLDGRSGGSSDPVRMYLKEIGKVPLLRADEEVMLARYVVDGLRATERIV